MKSIILLVILLLFTSSFAAIIESGDNGVQFAEDTAAAYCYAENVQAVYHCFGNVIRVVSTVEGEGSTFYKPSGAVVHCPIVAPTDMGAECLQMMTPNYCPTEAECGAAPVPQIFPGQNDTPEQTGDDDYYIVDGEAASDNVTEEVEEPVVIEEPEESYLPEKEPPKLVNNEEVIPAATENKVDNLLGDLAIVILVLGILAVVILFMLFKKSINE
jgi:hypothetical protein